MVFRRIGRWTIRFGAIQSALALGFAVVAKTGEDHDFEAMVARGTHVTPKAKSGWFQGSSKLLSAQEERCVSATTALLEFNLSPEVLERFSGSTVLNDPWFRIETIGELRDAWEFLSLFFVSTAPYVTEIVRLKDRPDELVLKLETDAKLKGLGIAYTFPSSMRIRMKPIASGSSELVVTAMEHRWFHGPVAGKRYFNPPFGDLADTSRRVNGFAMSVVLSRKDVVSETLLSGFEALGERIGAAGDRRE